MALSCFVDAFNIGTGAVASTVARTGYGFQPKACIYWWSGRTESVDTVGQLDLKQGIGVAVSATDRRCVTVQSDHAAATMATDRKQNNAQCIECLTTAGAVDGNADLQSFDSDGQTLVIDDQFTTNLRVHCLALGGSDLTNVATFQFQAPTTGGNADFTGLSFQPDAILLFSAGITTAPPAVTTNNMLSIGMATASAQGVAAWYDNDASNSSDTASYGRTGECITLFASATSLTFHAALVSFLSNGFRLNWSEATTGQPYIHGLALKGGSYRVDDITMSDTLNTTQAETSFGFPPTGALFVSHCTTFFTADTPEVDAVGSIGAMSSASNRGAQGWASTDATGNATCGALLEHDEILACVTGSGLRQQLLDMSSVDSDGFTTIVDLAGVQAQVFYLAFGSSGGAPPTPAILRQMMHHHGG